MARRKPTGRRSVSEDDRQRSPRQVGDGALIFLLLASSSGLSACHPQREVQATLAFSGETRSGPGVVSLWEDHLAVEADLESRSGAHTYKVTLRASRPPRLRIQRRFRGGDRDLIFDQEAHIRGPAHPTADAKWTIRSPPDPDEGYESAFLVVRFVNGLPSPVRPDAAACGSLWYVLTETEESSDSSEDDPQNPESGDSRWEEDGGGCGGEHPDDGNTPRTEPPQQPDTPEPDDPAPGGCADAEDDAVDPEGCTTYDRSGAWSSVRRMVSFLWPLATVALINRRSRRRAARARALRDPRR